MYNDIYCIIGNRYISPRWLKRSDCIIIFGVYDVPEEAEGEAYDEN